MAVRMVGSTEYVSMPSLGGKWMKMSLSDLGFGGMLEDFDPTATFQHIAPAITAATYVGSEKINGTEAAHYTLTVDPNKATSALPSDLASTAANALSGPVTEQLWLDADHLPVKTHVDMAIGAETAIYSRINEPVSVQVPPASRVTEVRGSKQ
jgi:hypothetical protein